MRSKNIYYDDLVRGNILKPLVITPLKKNAFIDFMRSQGKLGGQNKVPRLSNDRKIAAELKRWPTTYKFTGWNSTSQTSMTLKEAIPLR